MLILFIAAQNINAEETQIQVEQTPMEQSIKFYSSGKLNKAKQILETMATQSTNNPSIWNNLAVIAADQEKYDQAIDLLKRALATNKNINSAYHNLSRIYAYKASVSYRKALALEPKSQNSLALTFIKEPIPVPTQHVSTQHVLTQASTTSQLLAHKDINKPLVTEPVIATYYISDADVSNKDILTSIHQWAKSWSNQDISAYFNSYITNYHPPISSHKKWKTLRKHRVTTPRFIDVQLRNIRISLIDTVTARAVFTQVYKSNRLNVVNNKQLILQKIAGNWKIIEEKSLGKKRR